MYYLSVKPRLSRHMFFHYINKCQRCDCDSEHNEVLHVHDEKIGRDSKLAGLIWQFLIYC